MQRAIELVVWVQSKNSGIGAYTENSYYTCVGNNELVLDKIAEINKTGEYIIFIFPKLGVLVEDKKHWHLTPEDIKQKLSEMIKGYGFKDVHNI